MNRQGMTRKGQMLAVVAALVAMPVSAQETIKPYVFANYSRDNNFFRAADDAEANAITGSPKKDETVKRVGAGVKLELPVSRQTFFGDAAVERNGYDRFTQLDNTGVKAGAGWNWVIGSNFDGTVAYKYWKYLSTFEELQEPTKDMHTQQQVAFVGGVRFLTDWRAVAELSRSDVKKEVRSELDRQTSGYAGELQFLTAANTYIGGRLEQSDIRYQHPLVIDGVRVPDDGKQATWAVVAAWEGSSKSQLTAALGRTYFDSAQTVNSDSTATTGRFMYDWIATAKFKINTALSRETETTDERAGYALTKGIDIKPSWQVTGKVSAAFLLRHKTLDYQGTNGRSDTLKSVATYLSYAPWRQLALNASLVRENRDSSEANSAYRDQIYSLGAEYRFY